MTPTSVLQQLMDWNVFSYEFETESCGGPEGVFVQLFNVARSLFGLPAVSLTPDEPPGMLGFCLPSADT